MNLTKKYMMFWCAIILVAVLADVFDVLLHLKLTVILSSTDY